MRFSVNKVFEIGLGVINKIQETQCEKLDKAGKMIAKAHMDGRKLSLNSDGNESVNEELFAKYTRQY